MVGAVQEGRPRDSRAPPPPRGSPFPACSQPTLQASLHGLLPSRSLWFQADPRPSQSPSGKSHQALAPSLALCRTLQGRDHGTGRDLQGALSQCVAVGMGWAWGRVNLTGLMKATHSQERTLIEAHQPVCRLANQVDPFDT